MPFRNRQDAGRRLAQLADAYRGENVIVLGLPRGGVPVAYEVARHLDAPLDVYVARKLGAPSQPEYGIGAIAPGGIRILDEDAVHALGISEAALRQVEVDEREEMQRRLLVYREQPGPPDVADRTVILVDDGLATGVTARAAIASLRRLGPRRIVFAVPVAAPASADVLRAEVDDLLVVEAPEDFRAVGYWYEDFGQTPDEEVVALLAEARGWRRVPEPRPAIIPLGDADLHGELVIPSNARGLVVFAHGSGSNHRSPRNRQVARVLQEAGLGTLLVDLLTPEEARVDETTRHLRFDIPLLGQRLVAALDWLDTQPDASSLAVGVFGASTGAAAALLAAVARPQRVKAVVSRGGRPDLAEERLADVGAPTLLLVGGHDDQVLALNRDAMARMQARVQLHVVQGATHLFEEPGAIEEVADITAAWFRQHLHHAPPAREEHGETPT